ncbi:phospholipase D-like domain-containing protein [Candidatus Bathyarchaeota archaeon]|nr:phospholipase D-like domain-containing protein [Candidatus Bathyarchaeota archaeon]
MSLPDERFLKSKDFFGEFRQLSLRSNKIRFAVAYLSQNGCDRISRDLERFLERDGKNRLDVIAGFSSYFITEPKALETLAAIKKHYSDQVDIRYYYNKAFHPKLFIFERDNEVDAIIGSSNLTWPGMSSNIEANVLLKRPMESSLSQSLMDFFNQIMRHAERDFEDELKRYSKDYDRYHTREKRSKKVGRRRVETNLPPDDYQPIDRSGSTDILRRLSSDSKMIWKISPGQHGKYFGEWIEPDGSGHIAVWWRPKKKLSDFSSEEELKNYINDNRKSWGTRWNRKGPNGGLRDPSGYVAQQLWRFYDETKEKQIVVAYSNKTIFAIGEISGKYEYIEDGKDFEHRKGVRWAIVPRIKVSDQDIIWSLGKRPTIFPVTDTAIIRKIGNIIGSAR